MRLPDVFRGRDRSIKNSIIALFPNDPEIRSKVNTAFENGHKVWYEHHLATLVPDRHELESLRRHLKEDTIEPR
jgi:hypothetical protein